MSIKYMTSVWESERWEGSALVMMLALADFANDNGYCWPSVATLAKKCRVKERQAKRIIRSLLDEENPGIEQARAGNGAGHSSLYRLIAENMKKGVAQDTVSDEERVSHKTLFSGETVSSEAKRVSPRVKKGVTHDTRSVKEPSIESSVASPTAPPDPAEPPKPASSGKKESSSQVKAILEAYAEAKGGGINWGKEGAWAKRIDKAGGTPETVVGCYQWLKADPFWEFKPVSLAVVHENLPEYIRYLERAGPPKEKCPQVVRIFNQYTGQHEERRLS